MRARPKYAPPLTTCGEIRAALATHSQAVISDPSAPIGVAGWAAALHTLMVARGVRVTPKQAVCIVERFGVSARIARDQQTSVPDDAVFGPYGFIPQSWLDYWAGSVSASVLASYERATVIRAGGA